MADDETLTPARSQDVAEVLAFALGSDGRRRAHQADDMMARMAAERLVAHLALSGFVIMRKPLLQPDSASTPARQE